MIRRSLVTVAAVAFLAGCGQSPTARNPEGGNSVTPGQPQAGPQAAAGTPAPAAVEKPAPRKVTIPAGTTVTIRTSSELSTKTSRAGDATQAVLESPLSVAGTVVAPRGAGAALIVAKSDPGGRVDGRASIGVRLGSLQIGGQARSLSTNVYVREAPGTKKKDAIKVGAISGVGAAIGAIAGGGKGAAIGAASGAGAGTAVVLSTRGAPAVIPAESVLQYRLLQPLTVEIN